MSSLTLNGLEMFGHCYLVMSSLTLKELEILTVTRAMSSLTLTGLETLTVTRLYQVIK